MRVLAAVAGDRASSCAPSLALRSSGLTIKPHWQAGRDKNRIRRTRARSISNTGLVDLVFLVVTAPVSDDVE
jgi:hypothetical protein